MIRELINFVRDIDDDLKNLAIKPKDGLHIILKTKTENDKCVIDFENLEVPEVYINKLDTGKPISNFLKKASKYGFYSWMIDTNKCFDTGSRSIHTTSPFAFGFKKSCLEFDINYSNKAEKIDLSDENEVQKAMSSPEMIKYIKSRNYEKDNEAERKEIQKKIESELKKIQKTDKNIPTNTLTNSEFGNNFLNKVITKEVEDEIGKKRGNIHKRIMGYYEICLEKLKSIQNEDIKYIRCFFDFLNNKESFISFLKNIPAYKNLSDDNYIIFYLDLDISKYQNLNSEYIKRGLFNDTKNNIGKILGKNNEELLFGVSGFLNTLNLDKTFLIHQTATFEIPKRITNLDALTLKEFEVISSILPTPLPIFIFKEELKKDAIKIFTEDAKTGKKRTYGSIVKELYKTHQSDFANFYLLYYQFGVLKDFDFVSNYNFELKDENGNPWIVRNLFNLKFEPTIWTVFDFQNIIIKQIFNNNLVKEKDGDLKYLYFEDIEEKYCKTPNTYLLIMKYRKAFYDFVYKGRFEAVTKQIFDEILQTLIIDDVRKDQYKKNNHTERYSIASKLNIWFSLSHLFFNSNNNSTNMANLLKEHQNFMVDLIEGKRELLSESEFAFASGQVIKYLLSKSRGADKSHARLEAFIQQSNYDLFLKAVIRLFDQYKHAPMTKKFERVMSQILEYENPKNNLSSYTKYLLAGYFSKNELFSDVEKEKYESLSDVDESEEEN